MPVSYFSLATGSYSQDWSNTGLITADDSWSGVPYVIGYRGDGLTSSTGTDPRTITADGSATPIDVNANETNPDTLTVGGVAEFHITNPTVALNGSNTASAPHLVFHLDATDRINVRFQANVRDLDGSADNAAQQVAVQYRTSSGAVWSNIIGGYIADATTGGTATQVTAIDVTLPGDANNAANLEIRVIASNAPSNDEWVGIDDIVVSSAPAVPPKTLLLGTKGVDMLHGTGGQDEIRSLGGLIDKMVGGADADDFVFGEEVRNGRCEMDCILDYQVGLDRIVLENTTVARMYQTWNQVTIVLEGDRDVIQVFGHGITMNNIDIVTSAATLA